jgi:hypothetical protein
MKYFFVSAIVILNTFLAITKVDAQFYLVASNPQKNASSVSVDQVITLEFSAPVDLTSASKGLSVTSNLRGQVTGSTVVIENSIVFESTNDFFKGEEITITVLKNLKSINGDSLSVPASLRFTTKIEPSPAIPPAFVDSELVRDSDIMKSSVITVDLDNDGDIDLLYGGGWLENRGLGDYENHIIPSSPYSINEVKAVDIDLDGDMDIIVANLLPGVGLLVNDGAQNFTFVSLTTNAQSLSLDVADFDSNGFLDIAYSNIAPGISKTFILFNLDGSSFANVEIAETRGIESIIVDLDMDGDWDIIQHDCETIQYLINTNNSFATHTFATSSVCVYDIVAYDFDNDGDYDVAAAEEGIIIMYVNDGELNFTPLVIAPENTFEVIGAGDFDGDGDIDLIVPDYLNFKLLLNDGSNSFTANDVQNSRAPVDGFNPTSITVADIDSDGDLDILSLASSYQIKLYKSVPLTEAYPFSPVALNFKSLANGDSDWGDYDNDGDWDVFMQGIYENKPTTLLYENQNGLFIEKAITIPGLYQGSCDWGDYDRDGDLDLLVMGAQNSLARNPITAIYTYENENFKLLEASLAQLPGAQHGEARWGDFNNDGRLDIIIHADEFSGIYQSDNEGNFSKALEFTNVFQDGNVDVGDYDHDGDLDFAITGWSGSDYLGALLKVYRNDGNWIFAEVEGNFTGRIGGNVSWADMDNDGDLDLVVSGNKYSLGPSITVYLYNNGYFEEFKNSEFLYYVDSYGTSSTGDYNNDGVIDVIASTMGGSSYSPKLTLLKNNGQGDLKVMNIELPEITSRAANWIDYDQDNDLDIFVGSQLLRNNTEIANSPPTPPTHIQVDSVFNNSIYLQWYSGDDIETGSLGLTYQIYVGTQSGLQDVVSSNSVYPSGFRKISENGTTKGNKTWVGDLFGGVYYIGVQSIDASFKGSSFSDEVQTFVIGIHGSQVACKGFDYSYVAKPAGKYSWRVSGGVIVSGQGTDSLVVNWNTLGKGYIKVLNSENDRNTLVVNIDEKPRPQIFGDTSVCTGLEIYTITDTLTHFTQWTVSGENTVQNESAHLVNIKWNSSGNYTIMAKTFPKHKGCHSYDTMTVKVDQRPMPAISGPSTTCTNQIDTYTTNSVKPVWEITNGNIVYNVTNIIKVKWSASSGNGSLMIKEVSKSGFCTSIVSSNVIINPRPDKPVFTVIGDTIISSPSPNGYYKWYHNDIPVISGPYFGLITKKPGVYVVEVFNQYWCGEKSDPHYFLITGLDDSLDNPQSNSLTVYPNPANEKIVVEVNDLEYGNIDVLIFSTGNFLVKQFQLQKTDQIFNFELDISDLNSSLYVILLKTKKNIYSAKFMKQ